MLQPPNPGSFGLRRFGRGGGGSTAAAVTLNTVADESSKMADDVTRSPSRLCSRDGKIRSYGDALGTIFLLLCLASYFSFSFLSFLIFPASWYVYCISSVFLRLWSSKSATLSKYVLYFIFIVRVLSACVIYTLEKNVSCEYDRLNG